MPGQAPVPLTGDELREIADTECAEMLPDETVQAIAAELLAARAEIAALRSDLDAKGSDFDAACRHLGEARERIAELEADHARLVEDVASTVRRFSATLDERDALRARVAELEDQVAALADAEMERARLSLYARNARRTITTMWQSRRQWQNRAAELEAEHDLADRVTEALDRIEVNRALEAAQSYREVWSDEVAPGGRVCSICGQPVESEPCPKHAPAEDPQLCDCGTCQAIASARATSAMASDRETLADLIFWEFDRDKTEPDDIAAAILAAGWRPPAREITDPADLDALPVGSIVLADGQAWTLRWPGNGWTVCPSCEINYCTEDLIAYAESVTVVHVPTEEAGP
ncbi:hypothetical protein FEK35_27240 [Nocardia cyriacigeorgica]|uniref:Uncharacterized protein n=1 Tax=Nocardia cyriacigeorgica TaxID=135487 RepID=A0A5R8P6X0_9NOCA|nr:hypothetical protein [Nocardia cyriacigeorgica]TLF96789.1 hypothetical protein FEK35_27240 [Nocardia cyriacigeorgica]